MNNQNDIASFLKMNARRRSPLETMQYVSPQDPNQMPSYAPAMPQQAAPQGDGTGAGDMDPSFIRAVQREMQGEQAPQGLPPVRGVQSDIAAGVEAASGFAYGGAVRGYQVGGKVGDEVREEDFERLRRLTGINDQKLLKQRMDELKGGGFFGTKKSVPELLSEMEAAKSAEFRRTNVSGLAGARPESVTGIDEVQPYSYPTPMGPASAPIVSSQPVDPAAVVRPLAPQRVITAANQSMPPPDAAAEMDTQQKPVDDGGYAERMKKLLDDDEGDMTPRERSMALIQTGAAMMAAASKPGATFLGSAGEGLTKGLEGFNETRSNRAVKRMKQAAMLQAERQAGIENTQRDRTNTLQSEILQQKKDEWEALDPERKAETNLKIAQAAYYGAGVDLRKSGGAKVGQTMMMAEKIQQEAAARGEDMTIEQAIQKTFKGNRIELTDKEAMDLAARAMALNPTGFIGMSNDEIMATLQANADKLKGSGSPANAGTLKVGGSSQRVVDFNDLK